jgi:hypothetical protein
MSKQITVKASQFINWFYHDEEDTKHIGEMVRFLLKEQGYAEVTIENIFNSYGELPAEILENVPEERQDEDIPTDEIEFINDYNK